MAKKGRPSKYVLTYEQKVWDNYSPYFPMKEPTAKELTEYYNEKSLLKMNKALTYMANSAGYEADKAIITIISKRLLRLLYN